MLPAAGGNQKQFLYIVAAETSMVNYLNRQNIARERTRPEQNLGK